MRRKHHDKCGGHGLDFFNGISGTKPTLPMIIILILILLQFGNEKFHGLNGENNGILFIIALFYLSCGGFCNSDRCC